MLLERFDKDRKGYLVKDSVPEGLWDRISKADKNGDGKVSKEELEDHFKTLRRPEAGGESTKPSETPTDAKPDEKKPKDNSPQAFHRDTDDPADAVAASNVVI
jgi:hypothetical protein